jgi:stage II sporulation protein E
MFQNIERTLEENQEEYESLELNNNSAIKELLKKNFTTKKIILYIIAFMISLVGFGENKELAPFGIALFTAVLSNCIPVGIITIIIGIGNFISFGAGNTLNYILTILLIMFSILVKSPKYNGERAEKRRLGTRLLVSCLIVQLSTVFFNTVIVYDLLVNIMYSILAYIFYKIFVNAIPVIDKIGENNVYSIEEVMGASLLLTIALTSLNGIYIFGYSVKNILCILVVLIMGWKNGILVGGTTGIIVGTVLGVIGAGEPIMIASYAISGMIAGIFSKFGKIGVVVGFVLGNVALTYTTNGNVVNIIDFQEILIAALGLLAVPKNIKINIEDVYKDVKLLPESTGKNLEENKETIYKLTAMSETISEIAKTYKEAAETIIDEDELIEQEKENFKIFEKELQNSLDGFEENILFEDIYYSEDNLLEDIFEELLHNEMLNQESLVKIFEKHNNYIIGIDENKAIKEDISKMIKIINNAYKISKLNFIWKKKLDENKKVVSNQLEEVSKAIGNLAEEIEANKQDEFEKEKLEIQRLLKEKEITIKNIVIKKENSGRLTVALYTDVCENVEKPACNIKKTARILSNVLNQNMVLQKQECGLRLNKMECMYVYVTEDKLGIQIGIAKETKSGSTISGDASVQAKLEDGKYLVAISDGMGSGKEARRSSNIAIAMLNKLLSSGFDKDTSLRLINSSLATISNEDMYATLDIAIFDLYAQNLEFIKNGACPTYVKNRRNVQVLKSLSLPTGILTDIDLIVYDKDLQDGDILVMCSDGILESSEEYTNKELWLKFLLEDIQTDDAQKIADIILQEAIDNNYGIPKDDMTVIVVKIAKKD